MQTFLPYPDLGKSARCLDSKRLGKQRVEAYQILNILLDRTNKRGWRNHPAVKMWVGYDDALKFYYNNCVGEWIIRGFRNNMRFETIKAKKINLPVWFGKQEFHASHRSNLLRKNKDFYSQYNWQESDDLPYVWPV